MTENADSPSVQGSQQESKVFPAVVYIDGVAHFDLAAQEIIYPIKVDKGKLIHFHLKPYEPNDLRDRLIAASPLYREQGEETEIENADMDFQRDFVADHLIRISNIFLTDGCSPSPDRLTRFLQNNPHLLSKAWREGVCGFRIIPDKPVELIKKGKDEKSQRQISLTRCSS